MITIRRILLIIVGLALSRSGQAQTAAFPGAIAGDCSTTVAKDGSSSTVTSLAAASTTTLRVANASSFTACQIATVAGEQVLITAIGNGTLTVTRGFAGTNAVTIYPGTPIVGININAWNFNALKAEIQAIETALGANLSHVPGFDPTTTRGDLFYRGASGVTRLPLGASGTFPRSNGVDLVYSASPVAATSGALHGDGSGNAVAVSGNPTDCVLVNGSSGTCGTGGGGGVSSVTISSADLAIAGSPITTSGTISITVPTNFDLSGKTGWKIPNSAGYTPNSVGHFGFNSTSARLLYWDGGAVRSIANLNDLPGTITSTAGAILKSDGSTPGNAVAATAGTDFSKPSVTETAAGDRTFTGALVAGSATRTAPMKTGTTLPGTCTVGDEFFKSNATAGANVYLCTATNTWTVISGAASIASTTSALKGDGAGNAVAVTGTGSNCVHVDGSSATCGSGSSSPDTPYIDRVDSTHFTVNTNASTTSPVGWEVEKFDGTITGKVINVSSSCTLAGGSTTSTVHLGGNTAGTLFLAYSTPGDISCTGGAITVQSALPAKSAEFYSWTTTTNTLDPTGGQRYNAPIIWSSPALVNISYDGGSDTLTGATGGSGGSITVNPGAVTCTVGSSCTIALSAVNPQTATYQVLAADFSNYKTITVASGTFTITLVASGSQPANGQYIRVVNYGSGVVTVARSGQNINGGTGSIVLPAASATVPTSAVFLSDGTNYFAAFSNPIATPSSGQVAVGNSGGTNFAPVTVSGNMSITSAGAATVKGIQASTTLPGTCTVGDLYFKTDATAGQNIYECQSTNTWTQQLNSGGSGGITPTYIRLGCTDFGGTSTTLPSSSLMFPHTGPATANCPSDDLASITFSNTGTPGIILRDQVKGSTPAATLTLALYQNSGGSGTASFTILTGCLVDGGGISASYQTHTMSVTSIPSGNVIKVSAPFSLDLTGCTTGGQLDIKVNRDGTGIADTVTMAWAAIGHS